MHNIAGNGISDSFHRCARTHNKDNPSATSFKRLENEISTISSTSNSSNTLRTDKLMMNACALDMAPAVDILKNKCVLKDITWSFQKYVFLTLFRDSVAGTHMGKVSDSSSGFCHEWMNYQFGRDFISFLRHVTILTR